MSTEQKKTPARTKQLFYVYRLIPSHLLLRLCVTGATLPHGPLQMQLQSNSDSEWPRSQVPSTPLSPEADTHSSPSIPPRAPMNPSQGP